MGESNEEIGKEAASRARSKVLDLLDNRPSTRLDRVFLRLGQALNAKKTEFFSNKGEVITKIDCIDNTTRLRAVHEALVVHDALPSEKTDLIGDITLRVVYDDESKKESDEK